MIVPKLLLLLGGGIIFGRLARALSTTAKRPEGHGDGFEGARQCNEAANSEETFQVSKI